MKILCYHGVTAEKNHRIVNFNKKHIKKNIFEKQMKLLRKKYNPISIKKVFNNLKNKVPFNEKDVCVTFDDGFENNFKVATKILSKYKIPAIFYICPEIIDKQEMFWVDKIEATISFCKKSKIELKFKNYFFKHNISSVKLKINAIKKFKKICKSLRDKDKDQIINELIKITDVIPRSNMSPLYKVANWEQIKKTAKNQLFDIGGHSLRHAIFTNMSLKAAKEDIINTKKMIYKRTGFRVKHFSYPEGKCNPKIIKLMKKNNIHTCPVAHGSNNNHHQDPFKLNRIMVDFEKIKFPFKY